LGIRNIGRFNAVLLAKWKLENKGGERGFMEENNKFKIWSSIFLHNSEWSYTLHIDIFDVY